MKGYKLNETLNKKKQDNERDVIDNLKDNQNKDKMNEGLNKLNVTLNKKKQDNERDALDNLKDNQNKDKINEGLNKLNDTLNKKNTEDKREALENINNEKSKLKANPKILQKDLEKIEKIGTLKEEVENEEDKINIIKPIINNDLIKIEDKEKKYVIDDQKKLDDCCQDMKLLRGWFFIKINSFIIYEQKCRNVKKYFSKWKKYAGIEESKNIDFQNLYQH